MWNLLSSLLYAHNGMTVYIAYNLPIQCPSQHIHQSNNQIGLNPYNEMKGSRWTNVQSRSLTVKNIPRFNESILGIQIYQDSQKLPRNQGKSLNKMK